MNISNVTIGGTSCIAGGLTGLVSGDFLFENVYANGNSTCPPAPNGGHVNSSVGGIFGAVERSGFLTRITNSYATGNSSIQGPHFFNQSRAGRIAGDVTGSFTVDNTYGFGNVAGGQQGGYHGNTPLPTGITGATNITDVNSGWSSDVWNFGTDSQEPILKYADYDGEGIGTDYCGVYFTREGHRCGDVIPHQSR